MIIVPDSVQFFMKFNFNNDYMADGGGGGLRFKENYVNSLLPSFLFLLVVPWGRVEKSGMLYKTSHMSQYLEMRTATSYHC